MAGKSKDTRTPVELVAAGLCMHGDGKRKHSRGVCATDYRACRAKIAKGLYTDLELQELGLWLAPADRGRKGGSAVEKKLRKLLSKTK
jgi:hypothetical protein